MGRSRETSLGRSGDYGDRERVAKPEGELTFVKADREMPS
jgi:hypothetical protein